MNEKSNPDDTCLPANRSLHAVHRHRSGEEGNTNRAPG